MPNSNNTIAITQGDDSRAAARDYIESNYGQITHNYFSFIDASNKITIMLDDVRIKEDYLNHYVPFVEWLDGVFDNKKERYTDQFLCNLLNLKSEAHDFTEIIVRTQTFLDLNDKLKNLDDLDKKIQLSKEISNEKIKCKEIALLFKLIFDDVIEFSAELIIEIIYLLLNTEGRESWLDNKVVTKFYELFEIKKDIYPRDVLIDDIDAFLYENESENIFIPSTCNFVLHDDNSFGILVKYPMNREIGKLTETEKKEMKAEFYTEVIHEVIAQKIDFNCEYFYMNNYKATLSFSYRENEIRSSLPKYMLDMNGKLLERFKRFNFELYANKLFV
jgi:hypothetical protein